MQDTSVDVVANAVAVTPAWLTAALRAGGSLPEGEVRAVEVVMERPTAVSTVARLVADYGPDAPPTAPRALFLKTPHPDKSREGSFWLGEREVRFYRALAPGMGDLPLLRCHSAGLDVATQRWHVLLDDVTATHRDMPVEWPLPPPLATVEPVVELLARLHAAWWGRELPPAATLPPPPPVEERVARLRAQVERFAAALGERLSPRRREIYDVVLAALPRLWAWRTAARPRTLVHGDAHIWNVLVPREGVDGPMYLTDWQAWQLNEPTRDLAYAVGLHWFPDQRARFEEPLLRHYHDHFQAAGGRDYAWDACLEDYRYSMIHLLFFPVGQQQGGLPARIWWLHLERGMAAFDDLGCAELVDGVGR